MREIKFRAWDKQKEQWFPIKNAMCLVINPDSTDLVFMTNKGPYSIPDTGQLDLGLNRWVLQQFTGLLDKNGKEIYEGDIVLAKENGRNYVIKFGLYDDDIDYESSKQYGFFALDLQLNDSRFGESIADAEKWFEIIGNIFENKELLNEIN